MTLVTSLSSCMQWYVQVLNIFFGLSCEKLALKVMGFGKKWGEANINLGYPPYFVWLIFSLTARLSTLFRRNSWGIEIDSGLIFYIVSSGLVVEYVVLFNLTSSMGIPLFSSLFSVYPQHFWINNAGKHSLIPINVAKNIYLWHPLIYLLLKIDGDIL